MLVLDILQELQNQVDNMKKISKNYMNLNQIQQFFLQLKYELGQKSLYMSFRKSKDLLMILNILQEAYLISGYTILNEEFKIFLKYDLQGNPIIKETKFVSSAAKRVLLTRKNLKFYFNDYPYGMVIIRTRYGIINIKECLKKGIGGEVLAYLN